MWAVGVLLLAVSHGQPSGPGIAGYDYNNGQIPQGLTSYKFLYKGGYKHCKQSCDRDRLCTGFKLLTDQCVLLTKGTHPSQDPALLRKRIRELTAGDAKYDPHHPPKVDPDGIPNHYVPANISKTTENSTTELSLGSTIDVSKAAPDRAKIKVDGGNAQSAKEDLADTLAAAERIARSILEKKKEADAAFFRQAHSYAHTGGHATDHKRDQKMPLALEVAAAHKNVVDLRYNRALTQVELMKRKAARMDDMKRPMPADNVTDAKTATNATKKAMKMAAEASKREDSALASYDKFKKETQRVKLAERRLRAKTSKLKALQASNVRATSLKSKVQKIKDKTNEVEIKTSQAATDLIKQHNIALALQKATQEAKNDRTIRELKKQLKQAKSAVKSHTKPVKEKKGQP